MPTSQRTRILLVEDDPSVRAWLVAALNDEGYEASACTDLERARVQLEGAYDLLLLDLGLPDGDGLELCRELRDADSRLPIIILTARDALDDRVTGLDHGADDYVAKPVELPELLARVRSVLRRTDAGSPSRRIELGELWVDPSTRTVGRGGTTIELRRREFDLLEFLLRSPGRTWTREQLLERVWGADYEGETRSVDMCVRRLRTRIERDSRDPRILETVWGVGYRIREESIDG